MEPIRDNPITRFTTFWWGLGAFFIFALILLAVVFVNRKDLKTLEDAAAIARYEKKAKVEAAQAASLPEATIVAAIPSVASKLSASKPSAVQKPEQLVPGSKTALELANAPAIDTSTIDAAPATEGPIDPAVLAIGKVQFIVCAACHGQNGEGGAAGPPLAGSEWVVGPVSNLIRIQLRGLRGPIKVKGVEYNFPAGMAPMAYQDDKQIAAVLTYVRNNFGNKASAVKADQVAALRSEVGKPQLTVEELVQP